MTKTVVEITEKFNGRDFLVAQYTTYDEMKKTWYHDMLREDISEFISFSACQALEDMIARGQK